MPWPRPMPARASNGRAKPTMAVRRQWRCMCWPACSRQAIWSRRRRWLSAAWRGIAHASLALAAIAEAQANLALAEARYRTAVRLCWEKREEVQLARCLEALARFYARCGVLTLADELLTAAAHAQRTLGMPETASLALPEAAHAPLEGEPPTLDHAVEYVLSAPPAFP